MGRAMGALIEYLEFENIKAYSDLYIKVSYMEVEDWRFSYYIATK